MKTKPLFFVFEGGDFSGKGTQIKLLKEYFERQDIRVTISREPGGSEVGERIRNFMTTEGGGSKLSAESELSLFMAGRYQHVQEVILPFLNRGNLQEALIVDRYFFSTWAYQMCGRELEQYTSISSMFKHHVRSLEEKEALPDAFIILDLDPRIAENRKAGRPDDEKMGFDDLDLEFKDRVRNGMLNFSNIWNVRHNGNHKAIVIDASKSVDEVHDEIMYSLRSLRF